MIVYKEQSVEAQAVDISLVGERVEELDGTVRCVEQRAT
jgi:hypothetical protein